MVQEQPATVCSWVETLRSVISPSTDNGDHENLNRLRIKGFSVGVGYGNQAWSDTIFESVVYGNVTGVKALGTTTFGERMTIIASSIQNNSHYAIDGNGFKSPGFSVKLIGSSIDYNGNGTDAVIQGGYISEGSHFEQTTGLFFDTPGAPRRDGCRITAGSTSWTTIPALVGSIRVRSLAASWEQLSH
jgi:hypothetical protein